MSAGFFSRLASSWSHSKTARSLAVAIGTRRVLRLFVVSPRNVIGATSEVHVLEPKRKHLALAHARVERGDDHRPQERRCDREESRFLALGDSPATLIVLTHLRTSVSVPRRNGVRSMYSRPTAQFIM
jgi:hypothetical protein